MKKKRGNKASKGETSRRVSLFSNRSEAAKFGAKRRKARERFEDRWRESHRKLHRKKGERKKHFRSRVSKRGWAHRRARTEFNKRWEYRNLPKAPPAPKEAIEEFEEEAKAAAIEAGGPPDDSEQVDWVSVRDAMVNDPGAEVDFFVEGLQFNGTASDFPAPELRPQFEELFEDDFDYPGLVPILVMDSWYNEDDSRKRIRIRLMPDWKHVKEPVKKGQIRK